MNREDKLGDTGDLVRPVVLCAIVFICKMQKKKADLSSVCHIDLQVSLFIVGYSPLVVP